MFFYNRLLLNQQIGRKFHPSKFGWFYTQITIAVFEVHTKQEERAKEIPENVSCHSDTHFIFTLDITYRLVFSYHNNFLRCNLLLILILGDRATSSVLKRPPRSLTVTVTFPA